MKSALNQIKRYAGRAALLALIAIVSGGVASCATAPQIQPRTTVILLPDEDGHVGAVRVSNGSGSQMLDQAYYSATAELRNATVPLVQDGSAAAVKAAYSDLLKAQPSPPRSFILYFQIDKTLLTEASKAQLSNVLHVAHDRKPTEITVFGHADSSGSQEYNLKLSADRARFVAEMLRAYDADVGVIQIHFFGDRAPLVPSQPGMYEPRNRRVEIVIL